MKLGLFLILFACTVVSARSQSTVGLVAHWDMNGTTNDASGNGHNGHANNITQGVGFDGVMGHAWYFNGTNSWITVPYSSAMNIQKYTISATLKVEGFYAGPCHGNIILCRGTTAGTATGAYFLEFTDYPVGGGCVGSLDTTGECFLPNACATGVCLQAAAFDSFNYTPHIVENQWYTVVATFNDTVYKIYVNNVLKRTVPITTPGVAMGTSTDSLSIGYCIYDAAAGYPYGFKGLIDDIRLYNRVLNDSEIKKLNPASVGTEIVTKDDRISVYPNPAHDQLTVSAADDITSLTITNLMGQTMYSRRTASATVQVPIADLPSGVYIVRINDTEIRKFVKE